MAYVHSQGVRGVFRKPKYLRYTLILSSPLCDFLTSDIFRHVPFRKSEELSPFRAAISYTPTYVPPCHYSWREKGFSCMANGWKLKNC